MSEEENTTINGLIARSHGDNRHARRARRIRALKIAIVTKKNEDSIDKVLAKYMIDEGIQLLRLKEYVKLLLLAEEIDGTIFNDRILIKLGL